MSTRTHARALANNEPQQEEQHQNELDSGRQVVPLRDRHKRIVGGHPDCQRQQSRQNYGREDFGRMRKTSTTCAGDQRDTDPLARNECNAHDTESDIEVCGAAQRPLCE